MQVIPSIDLQGDRSRLVWWPGASTGAGTPTDRPDRVARALVELGAPAIHLVDLDGPARGRPVNLSAVSAVSRAVAVPLQLAGGVDGPEQVEIAFAAGATRVVLPMWLAADEPSVLAACLAIAGDWLAVGLDARPERLAEYPWRDGRRPTLAEVVARLAGEGVRRFVLSHGGAAPDLAAISPIAGTIDADVLVAGGVTSLTTIGDLRDAGVAGVILGEVLFTGAIDLRAAITAAA
jgi:phosphoribosylformimino-5-aminoimidazole carboxamide ribotide isomerase